MQFRSSSKWQRSFSEGSHWISTPHSSQTHLFLLENWLASYISDHIFCWTSITYVWFFVAFKVVPSTFRSTIRHARRPCGLGLPFCVLVNCGAAIEPPRVNAKMSRVTCMFVAASLCSEAPGNLRQIINRGVVVLDYWQVVKEGIFIKHSLQSAGLGIPSRFYTSGQGKVQYESEVGSPAYLASVIHCATDTLSTELRY